MIEKNYESKEELKEAFNKSIEDFKINSKEDSSYHLYYLAKPLIFRNILLSIQNHDKENLVEFLKKADTNNLLYGNNLDLGLKSQLGFNSRLIYLVDNENVSIFDLYGWTVEEVEESLHLLNHIDVTAFKILYSYFVIKKRNDIAEKVFEMIINTQEKVFPYNDDHFIVLVSKISNEYIPVFNYYEKQEDNKISTNKFLIMMYIKSIYNVNEYLKNEFNRDFYNNFYKKYKDIIKTIDTTSFFVDDMQMKKKEGAPIINNFDLVESDPVVKERVFRIFNFEFAEILRDMLRKDQERTEKLMYDYLNTAHYKGKKRRQFLSTYSRLKDVLNKENIEFDPFRLNEDLQSHIVLHMLN
jgi:hypothetical protein